MNINANVKTTLFVERNESGEECEIVLDYANATSLVVDMFPYSIDEGDENAHSFNQFLSHIESQISFMNDNTKYKVTHMNMEDDGIGHFILATDSKNTVNNCMYVTVMRTDEQELTIYGEWFFMSEYERTGYGKFSSKFGGLRFLDIV